MCKNIIILLLLIIPNSILAFENPKVKINNFYIQKYEVTIAEFSNFANKTNFKTEAEKQGFSYEYQESLSPGAHRVARSHRQESSRLLPGCEAWKTPNQQPVKTWKGRSHDHQA